MLAPDALTCTTLQDPRALQIVQLKLAGLTWDEVSAKLRVDPATVWRIRQRENLDEIIQREAEELHRTGMLRLHARLNDAIDVTAEIMNDETAQHKDRLAAAKEIMSWAKVPAPAVAVLVPGQGTVDEAARSSEELEAVVVSSRNVANDNAKPRGGKRSKE